MSRGTEQSSAKLAKGLSLSALVLVTPWRLVEPIG
jgi:hypothetical protein